MQEQQFLLQRVDKNEIKIIDSFYACQLSSFDIGLQKTSQYLTQAILLEVSAHPKPGLVTRLSNGSHQDMSLMTFMMSSAVLSKAFQDLQDIGMAHQGTEQELFAKIRAYGVTAEQELLRVTKGVNTQRGILFAGGIISGAAGYAMNRGLDCSALLPLIKEMTAGLVDNELRCLQDEARTAGEKLYRDYGITGIRGEVEKGFPSVVYHGLPALQEAFARGASLNDALVHTLLALMTTVEDSNVIWRTDVHTSREVQAIAADILAKGDVFTEAGRRALAEAEKYFVSRRISPGGSADLLSVTITFYLLANKEFPTDIF
ncbi:MAG: triphosphoribosyl-dephospho-CoA synthase CitG [Phascolarctobacterium sp.]|uniref:triphosphoribosyl-dephospho-CoA synthase CitG n=1 Tax=Phascolarctobacterium sp. TaxID=2049039 RepID=UPI0026DD9827|nr:triphosphoribosyl-dephospho-CoA synthase CitG [Phascolarctobacterium sp.]MDO4921010.1 triphosphoribosyl-dephospho-CoA synthase CitG [Phascolarctobacterium sp.]